MCRPRPLPRTVLARSLAPVVLASAALAQSPAAPPSGTLPPPIEGLRYGPEPYMIADLQLSAAAGPRPLVLYLHGGGGVVGPVAMEYEPTDRPWADFLAAGYPILSAHYGNAFEGAVYPAQNEAVRLLFAWIREELLPSEPQWFDGRFVLWGVSHGGLLGLREAYHRDTPGGHRPDLATAWVAPTFLPWFQQDAPTVLASHFTGAPYATLSQVPTADQLAASPASALSGSPASAYVPTFAAYWLPPAPIPQGELDDVHHGVFGALLELAHPGATAVYYTEEVGPLPKEVSLLDPDFPVVQTLDWIAANLAAR